MATSVEIWDTGNSPLTRVRSWWAILQVVCHIYYIVRVNTNFGIVLLQPSLLALPARLARDRNLKGPQNFERG